MKKVLSGNEAIARGAYEAGVRLAAAYPGTPSTEILETIARDYPSIYAEWAPNEKVALEVVSGASYAGARTMAIMKHVGVNVAADPLMTLPYTLIRGGLVLVSADDPELFSSQNEQDNRHYARFAKIPLLEPSSSQEAKDFVAAAFAISEGYGTPVMLRTTTRIAHSMGVVTLADPVSGPEPSLERHPVEWVMLPANARRRHPVIEERLIRLKALSNGSPLNVMQMNDPSIGIIASGVAYQYAREALPDASFLKLGFPYPFPDDMITEFAALVKDLWVVEELDPFIEEHVKSLGLACKGKGLLPICGELSPDAVRAAILGKQASADKAPSLPGRPPSMCPGCPHRGILWALKKNKCFIAGDIGCYTLGALAPMSAIDTVLCMGASVGMAQGFARAQGDEFASRTVAVIGDSTFLHSGVTSLMSAAYNRANCAVLILDNRTTGMTGHQPNPATGCDIHGNPTTRIDLAALCRASGIEKVTTVDAFDLPGLEAALHDATSYQGPAVVIAGRACALLDKKRKDPPYAVDRATCTGCMGCMRLGCPAIEKDGRKARINSEMCAGCGLCADVCRFSAIRKEAER